MASTQFEIGRGSEASSLQCLCLSSSAAENLDVDSIVLTQVVTQGTAQGMTFRLAVAQNNILTFFSRHSQGEEEEQEETLEFENACDALAWDSEGLAVIVGDASGTLHFTDATSGQVVFSHRIVPRGSCDTFGSEEPRILSISFVGPAPAPALVVLFDNGDVFGISKLPVGTICGLAQSQPQVLAAAVQRLQFLRLSLELNGHDDAITKASACSCSAKGTSWASVLSLDCAGRLLVTELNTALPSSEASAESSCWQLAEGSTIVDFVVVASSALCVSLSDNGILALWDLGARAKLASCPSSSSPLARLVLSLVHHHREGAVGSNAAAGAEDVVFVSVGSSLFALGRGGLGVALGPVPGEASEGPQVMRPATDCLSGLFIHTAESDPDASAGGCELSLLHAPALLVRLGDFARGVQLAASGAEVGALLSADGTSLADASTCTLAGYLAALASDLCSTLRGDAGLHQGLLSLTILPAVKAAMQSQPTLLPLILSAVRSPPVGFVSIVLGTLQGDEALLEDWRRRLATAKDLVALASGGGETESAGNKDDDSDSNSDDDEETEVMPDPQAKALKQEELLRRAYLSLRPSLLASTYAALVSRGLLEQAARVLSAHAWSPASTPFAPLQLLKSVPGNVTLGRLQEWVSTHLVPTARRLLRGQEGAKGIIALALYGVAGELASRALAFERSSSSSSEEEDEDGSHAPSPLPLAAMTTASRLLHSVGVAPPQGWPDMPADVSKKALQRVGSALLQLQTQAQAWERLGVAYSLAEVQQLGLQGIAAERLWVVPEAELLSSMPTLQALLRDFRGDLDAVLSEWIRDATMRKVIVDRDVLNRAALEEAQSRGGLEAVLALLASTAPLDVEHSEGSLSRLILGASAIVSPALRAEAVLLLLQTPAITGSGRDEEENREPESDDDDAASESSTSSAGGRGRGRGKGRRPLLVNSACSAALNLMAAALLEPSPTSSASASSAAAPQVLALPLRESLAAALRAQKIRTLAHKYGVVPGGFDPRSQQQVRALVRLVSSRVDIPDSLADCLYIAEIWGSTGRGGSVGLDVSSVLTRAIVARASDASVAEGDVESVVVSALAAVPAANLPLVAEDALACLLGNLDDVLRRAGAGPTSSFCLSDPGDKDWARRLCRGALVVASAFLDKRGGKEEARAPSASNSGPFGASGAGPVSPDRVALLKRMRLLQQLDIFVSEATLRSARACQETARALAARRAEELLAAGERGSSASAPSPRELALSAVTPSLRRACNLLGASSVFFLHGLFKALLSGPSMTPRVAALAAQVARCMQVEGSSACSTGPRAAAEESSLILDTALHLCGLVGRRGAMAVSPDHASASASASASPSSSSSSTAAHVEPFFVARELLALAAVHGSSESVSRVVDLVSGTELALAVLLRTEGGSDATSADESAFRVSAAVFERDGLIMPAAAVVPPLLKFSLREQLRRSLPPSSSSSSSSSEDVEELVQTLQKYESHLLASRVLCHSWALGAAKTALLRTSLTALSRRILSYREIDCDLAVATLLSLPFDTMVSELKASVPTIQSDFSRLLTVAVVGEELARLWDHEQLLQVFQGLQINARWWGLLTGYGIAIEPSLFQSENARARDRCIRDMVPLLLDANRLDLDEAVEYCRQFDLEPEFAVLCYVERLLLQEPTFPSDPHWPRCIRAASQRAPEEVLLRLFRRVLGSIDGRDYEKIIFLAGWLVSSDEDELDGPRSTSARSDEVALYRHYIDVCSFLTSLPVPPEAAAAASTVTTVQALSSSAAAAGAGAGAGAGAASAPGGKASKGVVGSSVYGARLSAWALISDPWAVLTPIFLIAPGVSVKLTPLVSHLGLDESEYTSKLLLASYADAAPGSGSVGGKASRRGAEAAATVSTQLQEQMLSIPCPITRVQTWQQLAALERERGAAPLAAALLLQGLQQGRIILSQATAAAAAAAAASTTDGKRSRAAVPAPGPNPTLLVSKSLLLDAHDVEALAQITRRLLAELTSSLLTLHGEQACEELRVLVSSSLWSASKGGSRLLAGTNPDQSWASVVARVGRSEEALCLPRLLLPRLLEVGAAVCWDLHLAALSEGQGFCCPSLSSLGSSGSPIGEGLVLPSGPSILDVLRAPLSPKACDLISGLRRLTLALARQWRELDATDQAQGDAFAEMRQALVGKLLSDVEAGGGGVGSGGSSSSGLGVGGPGQGSVAAAAAWASPSATPLLQPTAAERRRCDDAYRAMCVSVFASCSGQEEGDGAELAAHEEQLEAVALGRGPRSMRRLSARSRLRAAQALLWLPVPSQAQAKAKAKPQDKTKAGARGLRDFLLCLAELQETRLACDEDTLRAALLPAASASASVSASEDNDEEREEAEAARAQHAQALVHTWLHDEGTAEAVVELARDVLLLSSSAGSSGCGPASAARAAQAHLAWRALIQHAEQRRFSRVLLQTLHLLRGGHSGWGVSLAHPSLSLTAPAPLLAAPAIHAAAVALLTKLSVEVGLSASSASASRPLSVSAAVAVSGSAPGKVPPLDEEDKENASGFNFMSDAHWGDSGASYKSAALATSSGSAATAAAAAGSSVLLTPRASVVSGPGAGMRSEREAEALLGALQGLELCGRVRQARALFPSSSSAASSSSQAAKQAEAEVAAAEKGFLALLRAEGVVGV